ncbi:peptidylprolyl isomerase [Paraburkholderia graminis]|uniref:peptidylprolyl isomerase n=1 Tax=Paraburkholderia graminis TaxID=60548 RepID=A0ABD5CTF3_9BURK|nr:peptidylprolyl isomerase [Paraburkholderia graminis]MDR6207935.1 peptidyl-prolyl cis-trans isomerase C [Paraburkholderia graminis]
MLTNHDISPAPASTDPLSVNGIVIDAAVIETESALHAHEPDPDHAARRTLVVRELLAQRAVATGLVANGAGLDDETIDRLLEVECRTPVPSAEESQRYYAANMQKFRSPDLAFARHILFALTEKAAMTRVRARAEEAHRELTQHHDRFDALARRLSNCPSGQVGGNLGQLTRGESVPEFEAAIFGSQHIGLLPGLVNTRYGFHIVSVERRIAGESLPFEVVQATIERYLSEHVRHKSTQQYLNLLASRAELRGIALDLRPGLLLQ